MRIEYTTAIHLFTITFAASAFAVPETHTVCLDGSCDHDTIQAAIDIATDGDVVELAPGRYLLEESLDTMGKAITIRGAATRFGTPLTILDGQGAPDLVTCRILTCTQGEGPDTIFQNLVIENGSESDGGGMLNVDSSPTLVNCWFLSNSASAYQGVGGGMYNLRSSPELIRCEFIGNWAGYYSDGGGLYNEDNSMPVLRGCVVTGNICNYYGGGISSWGGSKPVLQGTRICGNDPDQVDTSWTDLGGNCVEEDCSWCPETTWCPEDLNRDGIVDGQDLTELLCSWGWSDTPADLDGNGQVNGADLSQLLSLWGSCH